MGSVKVDLYGKEKDFKILNLSDENVVHYLIKYRDKVDMYFGSETNNFFDNAGDVKALNQELIALYADLDVLIKSCNFSDEQNAIIHLLSIGYEFEDVARHSITSTQGIKRKFNSICKKIVSENNRKWSIWSTSMYLKSEWRTCRKCDESLPLDDRFYSKDKKGKNGYKTICKKCR